MVSKIKRALNKKTLLVIVAILIATVGVVWFVNRGDDTPSTSNSQPDSSINYGPPTEEEKQETERHKQELEDKLGSDNSSTPAPPSGSQASIVMTYATYTNGGVEASGFVSNVFEDGGTCTLTLSKGSLSVTGNSQGFVDVNKTSCPPIVINRSQIPESGDWTAVLSYSSSSAKGSSSSQTINVP